MHFGYAKQAVLVLEDIEAFLAKIVIKLGIFS